MYGRGGWRESSHGFRGETNINNQHSYRQREQTEKLNNARRGSRRNDQPQTSSYSHRATSTPPTRRNHSVEQNSKRRNDRRPSGRVCNPGSYGGQKPGQTLKPVMPNERIMQNTCQQLRPFAYGDDDDYEEEVVSPPVYDELPRQPPKIPINKFYMMETKTEFDENGNVVNNTQMMHEFTLGDPSEDIVIADDDYLPGIF